MMKALIQVHDVEQGTPEWQELRRVHYYTGTSAHKVLRFGTIPYSRTDASGSFGGNFYTRRGHLLEDEAIGLYARLTGRSISRPGFITNSQFPVCGYSPDGIESIEIELSEGVTLLQGGTLLECKAFNRDKHLAVARDVPFEILAQIHFGMLILGFRKAKLLLYNPDFAKKIINGKPNLDYDPKKALIIIEVKHNANIAKNFRNKLSAGKVTA